MSKRITFILTLLFSLTFTMQGAANRKFTLVIDAGHGGHDAGALGATSKEKNINLNVALAFGGYVERNCPDVKVIYTRKTDVFIPLHERADIANRAKADLFISIHTNALPGGHIARGLETYTLGMHRAKDNFDVARRENSVILVEKDYKQRYEGFDPKSSESYIMFEFMQDKNMAKSVELAKMVQRNVCSAANRPDKGVKQAGFLVLRETSMPSCLIELGFITTPDEETLLNDPARIDKMGNGIYRAFMQYRNKYNNTPTIPYAAQEPASKTVDVGRIVPREECETPKADNAKVSTPRNTATSSKANGTSTRTRSTAANTTGPSARKADTVAAKKPALQTRSRQTDATDKPVFKLQVMACETKLPSNSPQLKGLTAVDTYQEGGMWKYTVGASTDYNEINRMRKTLADKHPQAFIIAFKNGKKMNTSEAIREFMRNKNKQK